MPTIRKCRSDLMDREGIWVGIDPGKAGAIAAIKDRDILQIFPHQKNMSEIFRHLRLVYDIYHCYLEKQHTMPHDGRVSAFSNGEGYGYCQGMLDALMLPYTIIQAKNWLKYHGISTKFKRTERKKIVAYTMQKKYPSANLYGPQGGLKDGLSDALAIADYCKHQEFFKGE